MILEVVVVLVALMVSVTVGVGIGIFADHALAKMRRRWPTLPSKAC